ncbi:HpaII family restriction endonuclease [Flavobacterium sp. CFBP9031]|uniref:HpaII family restriction endonuclease n=1 Tax=Flavobacterium sp. CFBP9031 TaxID=3096538 RepID=UPI002A6AB9D8|nr:HpaII family restriction endonuclease [Flavobacterium sp. CFBP9031]MDY0990420.1 HpaII family restriction endonuclease [Flavobacterium sp. CFBP9031]
MTGNKGEWSEIYALFKLLGDKVLASGNEKIEKIPDILYPIIKILRSERNGNFEYSILDDIVLISEKEELLRIPVSVFKEKATYLLQAIKSNQDGNFSVPEIEDFMQTINCISIKASSSAKTDITIVIHDQRTNQQPVLGFSIKSQLGNPSTLLNAGRTTNFIFSISGLNLSEEEIDIVNSIDSRSKIKDRIEYIKNRGGYFNFSETEQQIFSNNLILIDSLLPQIISNILIDFYTSAHSKLLDLVSKIEETNPLNFDITNKHKFYSYKIKRFLTDVALGMTPSKVWNGEYDATGGYLVIKEDGEIVCYHIYNKSEFENYLLNNTKLETASSSRHGFGMLYKKDGDLFFKLNLQIRFIK